MSTMNSIDPTIDSIQDISKLFDEDCNCTANDKTTGELCDETETLKIINQFQKLYEARIKDVDREAQSEYDKVCMKLEISQEWIKNLKEQNIMLVQVVEDLEQTACNRVKLLEEKLKHSSTLINGNVENSVHTEKTINNLSHRVNNLAKDEEYMYQKIKFLQSDIRGLLELIRRAVEERNWNLEDIKFFEIQPSDIPIPNKCTCDQEDVNQEKVQSLELQVRDLQERERKMVEHQTELEERLTHVNSELESKEDTIKKYTSQFKTFTDNIKKHTQFVGQNECNSFAKNLQDSFDLLMKNNNSCCTESINLMPCTDFNEQFTLMDIFKACAIEAQSTVEEIKDEMNVMVSSFKGRHQKYTDLNKEVTNVQNQLIKGREKIAETISKLQLREEEEIRQNEKITLGKIRLKDLKNKVNHAQSKLSACTETQNDMQENIFCGYSEMYMTNDLLCSVIDDVEKAACSLQAFQTQGCSITSDLEALKNQLSEIDTSIKKLHEKIGEALSEHDMVENIIIQKEQKLEKLEKDVDVIHVKIKNILGTSFSPMEQIPEFNITEAQLYMEILNEVLKVKQDVYKLRKEHDDLKYKTSQKSLYAECDKRSCLWKSRVTDLQDQVKILQHEAKCNQEANDFLRNNLGCIEEELRAVQSKADSYRRSHFIDNMELKKKIIKLENTIKLQTEIEFALRQQLSESEVELKKSKDLLNSCHAENSLEEALLRCACNQFKHDTVTVPQLFKALQNTFRSTKSGLQELKAEFKQLICEDMGANFRSSAKSFINLMDNLQKHEDELENCIRDIEELKNAVYSKDKLIKDKDEMIKIQKDSIALSQAELKELHQKLQEKIDKQDQVISQYEKEKKELLKQNELQVQTIGHLQNAVVEAKKCIDQMGHRTESNRVTSKLQLEEKAEAIRLLTVYLEETQRQYNECFAEAVKQDKFLDLQRNAISELQEKISSMEYDHRSANMLIHTTYYSILRTVQEQVQCRMRDIPAIKNKMDSLLQSKCYFEDKYLNTQKLWQEAEEKLHKLRNGTLKSEYKEKFYEEKGCQCERELKDCSTQDTLDPDDPTFNSSEYKNLSCVYDLQSEVEVLTRENEDMKRQLQKYKLDFDIIDNEFKLEKENDTYVQQISLELQKLRDTKGCLQYENEQLKCDLNKQTQKVEDLLQKLQLSEENDKRLEILMQKLENKQMQINDFCNQITSNETVMKKQAEVIDELEKKLDAKNRQTKQYLSELDDAEEEMSTLHERITFLKSLLKAKSDEMVKLQADFEVLKNDNSILRMESNSFENRRKEDICHLQLKLKDVQKQLCFTENNYHKVKEDFDKTQNQLIKMSKREADLQECLTNIEKEYCLKLSNVEKEKAMMENCLHKLRDELEDMQQSYSSKSVEHCKLQDICKSYVEQLEILQQQIENEREKVRKMEESNRCIVQQLQECVEQNCALVKEKTIAQQNNCEIISELQETHKSLLDFKRKYQLKNKSLACISAELTETAMSRSELCNHSQYVVSCIRIWMEEQREYVNKLSAKIKSQQQELLQLDFEKKTLLDETRKLKRINHSLVQRIKRIHKHGSRNIKNACIGCQILPQNIDIHLPLNSKYLSSQKKLNLMKTARRISVCGSASWFPRMKYLVNELRKSNVGCNENCFNGVNSNIVLEENHDCGYQSSTSK